ncbi:hypothetical protein MKW92_027907 [Papaver armeniacum]|nr:hypothetical protein MKW92_027907 [Papaver armeniacum]
MKEKNGLNNTKLKSHGMERYFKKKARFADTSSNSSPSKRHRTIDGNASSSQPNTSCSQTNNARLEESDISVQVQKSDTPKEDRSANPKRTSTSINIVLEYFMRS